MPGTISNPLADLANVVGNIVVGKRQQEQVNEEEALSKRMQQLRESQALLDTRRANQQDELLTLERNRDQREQTQFNRGIQQQDADTEALRSRLRQLSPNMAGIESMTLPSLQGEIQRIEGTNDRLTEINASRKATQLQQLEYAQRTYQVAANQTAALLRQLQDARKAVRMDMNLPDALKKGVLSGDQQAIDAA